MSPIDDKPRGHFWRRRTACGSLGRVQRVVLVLVGLASLFALGAPAAPLATTSPRALPGWTLYDRYCLACHGAAGDGQGPAAPYTWGRPRALTAGEFRWRSTKLGEPPTDEDLRTLLRYGAPGTSMPGVALPDAELDQLVAVVKAFAPAAFVRRGTPVELGPPPAPDPARGAALWARLGCAACHGPSGAGDGPAAQALRPAPRDLASLPVRRPRASDDRDTRRRAIALSIATGLAGTSMAGYAGAVSDAELWALADHVLVLGRRAARSDRSRLDPDAIAADRAAPIAVGVWPGRGDPDEAVVFGAPLAPQGEPPASLAPAQASLSAQQCARCHAKQFREWQGSIHAAAASAGVRAQIDHALTSEQRDSCERCHTPLAEQRTDRALRHEGVTCAACHVRQWTRHGPPASAPSLLPLPGYPAQELAIYERADFCLPCHQLPPRTAVAGKPLLNTYQEWLEGPYARRGVQCQHCHMPNREHTFLGVHDPATFRQGIALTASARRADGKVTVAATLANVGAGHYLPTTPTPAVWLRIELVDGRGAPIAGARAEQRIGRDIVFDGATRAWRERADTRIPPGERVVMARAWTKGASKPVDGRARSGPAATAQAIDRATAARVTVEVHPDAFYEQVYAGRLTGALTAEARALTEAALARARASHYVAEQKIVPIR